MVTAALLMGTSSLGFASWYSAYEKQMPNASWRRWGVASARGGVSPTLEAKRRVRRAAQAQRGSLGKPLAGARGKHPLAAFALVVAVAFQPIREGRCGEGTAPLRRVAKDRRTVDREETSAPRDAFRKPEHVSQFGQGKFSTQAIRWK